MPVAPNLLRHLLLTSLLGALWGCSSDPAPHPSQDVTHSNERPDSSESDLSGPRDLAAMDGGVEVGLGEDLGTPGRRVRYVEVTQTGLPTSALTGLSMDVVSADVDGDGSLDLIIAHEFRPTILLLNDGSGTFRDESRRFPQTQRDSEDLAVADLDGDGDLDVLCVSEDDRLNELFLQQQDGSFVDASERLPGQGTSNAIAVARLGDEERLTVIVGNHGQNFLWLQDGQGGWSDETEARLPMREDGTQDLELGDVDGDGDLDLIVGNEDENRLLYQEEGVFVDAPPGCLRLSESPEETRDVELGDVDGDGHLDVVFGNVRAFVQQADPSNRLLLNDGSGCFRDETEARWSTHELSTFDADLVDLDGDGDLDLITANLAPGLSLQADRFRAFLNDGQGVFLEETGSLFETTPTGKGFDVEAFDADGDGLLDLYLASRGTLDRLYLRRLAED